MSAPLLASRLALKCDVVDPCASDHTCHNHKVLAAEQERLIGILEEMVKLNASASAGW